MALTSDREITFFTAQELVDIPVDDNVVIYKGALVGRNVTTGYARPLQAGDDFLGIAYRRADNTIAGHTAGGISVRLHQSVDVVHALSGVSQVDVGKDVYASGDDTLTFEPAGASRVGRVVAVEGANKARVRCQPVVQVTGALEGTQVVALADASASLTLNQMNRVLLIANTVARTLTLPPVASVRAGGWVWLVKTSAAAAAVTLDGNGTETIDGAQTFAGVDAQYDTAQLVCTGTEWIILSRDIA